MAERSSSLKDPGLYDELREKGESEQKAARISNAVAARGASSVGQTGGRSPSYEEWTVPDLKTRAKELGLTGYSRMTKPQLVRALRES